MQKIKESDTLIDSQKSIRIGAVSYSNGNRTKYYYNFNSF